MICKIIIKYLKYKNMCCIINNKRRHILKLKKGGLFYSVSRFFCELFLTCDILRMHFILFNNIDNIVSMKIRNNRILALSSLKKSLRICSRIYRTDCIRVPRRKYITGSTFVGSVERTERSEKHRIQKTVRYENIRYKIA